MYFLNYHVFLFKDVNDDVAGAMKVGIQGVLVKTGKFLPAALASIDPPPTAVVENFSEAVDWILSKQCQQGI